MTDRGPDYARKISALFDAERATRKLHLELSREDPRGLLAALSLATRDALGAPDPDEASLRLVRISGLLGDIEGPAPVDLLIDILASDSPEGRVAAGEALEDIAFDRFKEIALGIERALSRLPQGSPALSELPYLLAEVAEPGCLKLLGSFLAHEDPEAVAAAIESLVELGDPAAAPLLKPLEKDSRQVQIEEEEGDGGRVSIGELASEARQLLAEIAKPETRPSKGGR
jgi:HEAT repeat protein